MKADGAEARLPVHVTMLAGTIGERHVPRPRSLAAAADFIAEDWWAHGHTLDPTSFLVDGHSDTNLIATCAGRTLANEILWIGCTSTRCVAQSGGGRQCQRRGRAARAVGRLRRA